MKVKPIGDRVLIKPLLSDSKTAGGIIIPDTAKEKTQTANVIEVGDGKEVTVKVGDVVMYDKYSGSSVHANGEEFLIVEMKNILALIK